MIIDPFHADLHKIIHEQINDRLAMVGNGGCRTLDEYRQQVGYLEALREVLSWCETIEDNRYGPQKRDN